MSKTTGNFNKIIVPLLTILFIAAACGSARAGDKLSVTFINVGQGDATLIESPGGVTVLIDGGNGLIREEGWDAGESFVVPYLKERGIKKIDYLVMTHADYDHAGGLMAVIKDFWIGSLWEPGNRHTGGWYQKILATVKKRKIGYYNPEKGDVIDLKTPGAQCKVLFGKLPDKYKIDKYGDKPSLIIKLDYGKTSFLFTGDAEYEQEMEMVRKYGDKLKSTIYKAGHHGSASSSNWAFMDKVSPKTAIISCGKNNSYGHPHKEVLADFKKRRIAVYRTDLQGNILIDTDGETYKVTTQWKVKKGK